MFNKFHERLKFVRIEKGISQKKLAEKLFVSQQAIAKWETDKATPNPETIQKIADFFNVSADYLLGREEKTTQQKKDSLRVPVLGYVAAGIPIEAIEEILDYEELDARQFGSYDSYFGLRIKGDSMLPRIQSGDTVIVRCQPDVESGDVAIVCINGSEATCKQIKKHPDGISLIPFNPSHEIKFFTNEEIRSLPITIIGKVVELRGKF